MNQLLRTFEILVNYKAIIKRFLQYFFGVFLIFFFFLQIGQIQLYIYKCGTMHPRLCKNINKHFFLIFKIETCAQGG